jgi:hypothetical protein
LRRPMGEQPRLCPVNHDRTDILRWGSQRSRDFS